jgi:hypothetical protein
MGCITFRWAPWSRYRYRVGNLSETDPSGDDSSTGFCGQIGCADDYRQVCARALLTLAVYHRGRKSDVESPESGWWTACPKLRFGRIRYAYVSGAWDKRQRCRNAEMPVALSPRNGTAS